MKQATATCLEEETAELTGEFSAPQSEHYVPQHTYSAFVTLGTR